MLIKRRRRWLISAQGWSAATTLGLAKKSIQTLKGFLLWLIPNVPFIKFDTVRVEKSPVFVLKRNPFMMFLLIFNVSDNVNKIRLTH